MTSSQILFFLPAALAIGVSPGANNLLAFTNGSRNGFLPAVIGLSGRCLAFAIMIAMVIVGLGALLQASELAFQIIKWGGVVYLAYLGFTMMRSHSTEDVAGSGSAQGVFSLARREFIVAMANPKAILLFTAFVPQFVDQSSECSFSTQLALLGAMYIGVEFVAAMGWAWSGSFIRTLRPSARRALMLNRATGVMMIGASGLLAATKRAQ